MMARVRTAVAAAALVSVILAGQLLGAASGGGRTDSARVIGETGTTYLTGLRIFVAELLWDRIDPLLDTYYKGVPLDQMKYMVPTLRAVVWLDPHFVQSYYISTWILARNGLVAESLSVAAEGVRNNPRSGILHVAYAQTMFLFGNDPQHAGDEAALALRSDTQWRDLEEQHDNLRIAVDIFNGVGRPREAAAAAGIVALTEIGVSSSPPIPQSGAAPQPGSTTATSTGP
jgi:hypothetical protein